MIKLNKHLMRHLYSFVHNFIYRVRRLLSIIHTKYRLKGNGVIYQNYRIVGTPIFDTSRGGRIVLGRNFCMNNGMMANQIGFNSPCVLRAVNGSIIIGDNTGMSQTTLIAKGADILIGNHVKLGGGVKVYTTDFHSLDNISRRSPKTDIDGSVCESVSVGDDCFVGAGVIILKGVKIGARSIIGAGSVVAKDIPSDCIAAGNPCKVIKSLKKI